MEARTVYRRLIEARGRLRVGGIEAAGSSFNERIPFNPVASHHSDRGAVRGREHVGRADAEVLTRRGRQVR